MAANGDDRSDAELLTGSVASSDAFAELYRRHAAAVLAYHYRRTGCPETAADLTAETFAEVFASRMRFRDVGAPAQAWVFTIAARQLARFARRQAVSSRYRRRLGMPRIELDDADIDRIHDLVDLPALRASLEAALGALPEGRAAAVRLRVLDELPYVEVASALGCSEGAARVRVSRGLQDLADRLELR